MATALGCLPSAIDEESVVNIFDLLKYWQEEPPTHVILALRYLGQKKKANPSKDQVISQMHELAAMTGQQLVREAPEGFIDAMQWAERMKDKVKGSRPAVN